MINIYNGFFFTFSSSCVWAAFSCCSAWAKRDIILPRSSWSVGTINNDHCECPFFDQESNPFAPEPPITTTSHVSHVWSSVKDNFVSKLCRRKRSFKPHQNEHDSVKGTDKKAKTGLLIGRREKSQIRDKFAEKLAYFVGFCGKFHGKLHRKAIGKKWPILWLFSRQISLEIDQFSPDQTSVFNVFLTEVIICSFNNNTLKKWTNGKAFNFMASAQFFAT